MVVGMAVHEYDVVFVGGGLAALLLLDKLGTALPDRVAVVDPHLPQERPTVHWSYWSSGETPYDRFATGIWRRARVADGTPEYIAPFALRLVRSTDVFAHLDVLLASPHIEWLQTRARSITGLADRRYEIVTDAGTLRATWVFDSATDVPPPFLLDKGHEPWRVARAFVSRPTVRSSIRRPQPYSTRWTKALSPTCCR
jgi:lycopene beta-cyclase